MTDRIYHMNELGQLEPMMEEQFSLEDTLQELVANYPELLSGEQMNPSAPRRWILVKREQGIADTEGGSYRWALDHLLIDQDAVPTLVEVKRSANSQVRREIVGQMLDYAAHARRTWSAGDIRRDFEGSMAASGRDPEAMLTELLQSEDEPDTEEFWQNVETNLRAARLRLLFVSDGIPDELTRVVEFLNEQMPGIEVLAVEVKQFRGDTGSTLVPRVIGRTAAAPEKASTVRRRPMDRDEFLDRMPSIEVKEASLRLLEVADPSRARLEWGHASVSVRGRTPAWRSPVTVAWLYPADLSTSPSGTFIFGAGNFSPDFFDNLPTRLVEVLESWVNQFAEDSYARGVSSTGYKAWAITHEDAAANINVLAERLDKVLTKLAELPIPPDEYTEVLKG